MGTVLVVESNFLDELDADMAIIGVPYDMEAQWRSGTRFGPRSIREDSTLYSFGLNRSYDPERDEVFLALPLKIVDCGDVDIVQGNFSKASKTLKKR
jgi:agmatinase